MPTASYDTIGVNSGILFDLPFREGTGIITQDVAKPHHPITMANTPTWTTLASGLGVLTLDGVNQYLQCANASSADLGFTTEDYSVSGWFNWTTGGNTSQIIMGRYEVFVGGWELYLYENLLLTMRHSHAGGSANRTAVYSAGWAYDTWHFMGFSRSGSTGQFYRNGVALATTGDVLEDPESTTYPLNIGQRYAGNTNYFKGSMYRLRIWSRVLTASEWLGLYNAEVGLFA